jgi:hypothetical protein
MDTYATKVVDMGIDYVNKEMLIVDQAEGMVGDDLDMKLSVIGNYTASSESRGFFSSGAKMCAGLGRATFTSIKDGKISSASIDMSNTFTMHEKDREVTSADRVVYGITKNGTHVRMTLGSHVTLPDFERSRDMPKIFSCRDYFADPTSLFMTTITLPNSVSLRRQMSYTFPQVNPTPLMDTTFEVDGYPGITARLVLHETLVALPHNTNNQYREYGVLVCCEHPCHVVHENTMFYSSIEQLPESRKVIGRLYVDSIWEMMMEIERGNITEENPIPIISQERNGLRRDHPFVKSLYRTAGNLYKYVLLSMKKDHVDSSLKFDLTEIINSIDPNVVNLFMEDLNKIQPFRRFEKDYEKSVNYITSKKTIDTIVSDDTSAKYPISTAETGMVYQDGDLRPVHTQLQVEFVDDATMKTTLNHYLLDGVIYIGISIHDGLISSYVSKSEDVEGAFTIHDIPSTKLILVILCSEVIAEHVYEMKILQWTNEEIQNLSELDKNIGKREIRRTLHPFILQLFTNDKMFESIITNDIPMDETLN